MACRIMTIFVNMKRRGLTIFKIIFILAVFFNLGVDAHSDIFGNQYAICTSSGENDDSDNYNQENDTQINDQIDPSYSFSLIRQPVYIILIPYNSSLTKNIIFTIWQPPKIS